MPCPSSPGIPPGSSPDGSGIHRRDLLKAVGAAGTGTIAGCGMFDGGGADTPTTTLSDEDARRLAERFAPTLYFDANERWFPTDPRPYESERDGEPVVDGFDALDGYVRRFEDAGGPPDPTVFYHALRYTDSPLGVVQFWWYSAFDQFSTNFHWHDWEALHAFVDLDSGDPRLYVASAHSRRVPNNEFLDPEPGRVPAVLSELGSHSSALSINDRRESFQRLPSEDTIADITNRALDAIESISAIPAAYGLPRDEGFRLPYLVPELDGRPIYDHDRLPAVERSDLVPSELTVRSFDDLARPPTDLPERETGTVFASEGPTDVDADVTYELVPTAELEHIAAFEGPQLSFEFAVPRFAEDLVAKHITTSGVPWTQPRYDDPVTDITDPAHRAALADRYDPVGPPGAAGSVVAAVQQMVGTEEAPEGEGLTTGESPVETAVLLESDATAVPTFLGTAILRDVPSGDHRLTVNGAGFAPHSEQVSVTAGAEPTGAGVDGRIALAAAEDAIKLRVDAEGVDVELTGLAVEDDFAGRLYDAPLDGPDAVYVHRGGAYTTEVVDADGAIGAFRVNPRDGGAVTIDRPRTGKASLAGYLSSLFGETRDRVRAAVDPGDRSGDARAGATTGGVRGLVRALEAIATAAGRAVERANAGDREGANRHLRDVSERLQRVADLLVEAREGLPEPVTNAVDRRLDQARERTDQALAARKL